MPKDANSKPNSKPRNKPNGKPRITFNPNGTLTVAIGPVAEPPGAVAARFPEAQLVMDSGVAVFMVPGVLDVMIAHETMKLKAKIAASPDPRTGRVEDLLPVAAMRTARDLYDALLAGGLPDPDDLDEAPLLDGWALIGVGGSAAPALIGQAFGLGEGRRTSCLEGLMAGALREGGFALFPDGYMRLGRPAHPEASLLTLLIASALH